MSPLASPIAMRPSAPNAPGVESLRKRVFAVKRNDDRSVHVSAGEVLLEAALLLDRLRDQEGKLELPSGEPGTDTAQQSGEERVSEDAPGGLRDNDADGFAAARGQVVGSAAGHVAELGNGAFHRFTGVGAHSRAAIHDPRCGCARNTGCSSDLVERSCSH